MSLKLPDDRSIFSHAVCSSHSGKDGRDITAKYMQKIKNIYNAIGDLAKRTMG